MVANLCSRNKSLATIQSMTITPGYDDNSPQNVATDYRALGSKLPGWVVPGLLADNEICKATHVPRKLFWLISFYLYIFSVRFAEKYLVWHWHCPRIIQDKFSARHWCLLCLSPIQRRWLRSFPAIIHGSGDDQITRNTKSVENSGDAKITKSVENSGDDKTTKNTKSIENSGDVNFPMLSKCIVGKLIVDVLNSPKYRNSLKNKIEETPNSQ